MLCSITTDVHYWVYLKNDRFTNARYCYYSHVSWQCTDNFVYSENLLRCRLIKRIITCQVLMNHVSVGTCKCKLQLRSKFASEIHINISYLKIAIFRNADLCGESESIGKDDDKKFFCVGCTSLRAYRNVWLCGQCVETQGHSVEKWCFCTDSYYIVQFKESSWGIVQCFTVVILKEKRKKKSFTWLFNNVNSCTSCRQSFKALNILTVHFIYVRKILRYKINTKIKNNMEKFATKNTCQRLDLHCWVCRTDVFKKV